MKRKRYEPRTDKPVEDFGDFFRKWYPTIVEGKHYEKQCVLDMATVRYRQGPEKRFTTTNPLVDLEVTTVAMEKTYFNERIDDGRAIADDRVLAGTIRNLLTDDYTLHPDGEIECDGISGEEKRIVRKLNTELRRRGKKMQDFGYVGRSDT